MKKRFVLPGLFAALIGVAAVLDRLLPPPLEALAVSAVVNDEDGLPLRVFPVEDGRWRLAADLGNVDPRFIEALLTIEDERFFEHGGVDGRALIRALSDNVRRGRIVSGASTITMQTARLLEPRPRNLGSKLIEMLRAVQIEHRLTKRGILELYLTLAPYGGNLEGVRTASRAYFGRDPKELTDGEIALLLALPQSPEARRPDLRPKNAAASRALILDRLAGQGFFPESRAAEAKKSDLPSGRRDFPSDAWHLGDALRESANEDGVVATMIDRRLQLHLQTLVRQKAEDHAEDMQAAAIVVRLSDRAVRAWAGSAGRDRPGGWLDLNRRRRSPGSTLKPFIYGLAMDEGLAAPGTLIADLPFRFGGYEPRNFERGFSGELTVASALQHSLNVPAVLMLDLLGPERLIGLMHQGGVAPAVPQDLKTGSIGLAVALGGLGVTAEDLALLYAGLGDGGRAKPLAFTPADLARAEKLPPRRILSQETTSEVAAILRTAPSLSGRMPAALAAEAPSVAFKTGTSYGYRDAWAAGFSGNHAVVVWIGRADGSPSPDMTGREAALPLLFDIFDTLPAGAETSGASDAERPSTLLSTLERKAAPEILFPPDGAVIWPPEDRPLVLAGRGGSDLSWFVDGMPIGPDQGGNILWQPQKAGFYEVTLIDREGQRSRAMVRVRMPKSS